MLGITVADSVLVGGFLLTLLAAWRGTRDGSAAAKANPIDNASGIVANISQANAFSELAGAVRDLTAAINGGIQSFEQRAHDEHTAMLREIADRLDGKHK